MRQRPTYSLDVRQPLASLTKQLSRLTRYSDCSTPDPGLLSQIPNGKASYYETPPPPSRNKRGGRRSVSLCFTHTLQSSGPSSSPYYPHLLRSLKMTLAKHRNPHHAERREHIGNRATSEPKQERKTREWRNEIVHSASNKHA
jgi:hypothetical protein